MAATWGEDSSLADIKSRLEKLRVDQARQVSEEEKTEELDTLKILESKFGSPVYDPTSPAQIAYARRCARAGRRQSIEFEDLYVTKGSGHLLRPPTAASGHHRGPANAAVKRTPSLKSSATADHSHHHPPHLHHPHHAVLAQERQRKSSDPTAHWRRMERQASEAHVPPTRKVSHGRGRHVVPADLGRQTSHEGSHGPGRPRLGSLEGSGRPRLGSLEGSGRPRLGSLEKSRRHGTHEGPKPGSQEGSRQGSHEGHEAHSHHGGQEGNGQHRGQGGHDR